MAHTLIAQVGPKNLKTKMLAIKVLLADDTEPLDARIDAIEAIVDAVLKEVKREAYR